MMNGVDYSKKLAQTREDYWKSLEDLRQSHKDQLDNVKETEELKTDRIKQNYKELSDKTHSDYNDRYDKMDETLKASLENKAKDYNRALDTQRKEAYNSNKEAIKDYKEKIRDLDKRYDFNIKETEQTFDDIQKANKENYDKQLAGIRNKSEQEVSDYKANAIGDSGELKDKMAQEQKQLVENYQLEKNQIYKQEIEKRNDLRKKAVDDIAKIREVQDTERLAQQERAKEKFERLNKESNSIIETMRQNTDREVDRMAMSQRLETKKNNEQFGARFQDQERRYNDNLRELRYENKRNGMGPESLQYKIQQDQQKAKDEATKTRIKTVQDNKDAVEKRYQKLLSDSQRQFDDQYKNIKINQADKLEKSQFKLNEVYTAQKVRDKEEREQLGRKYDKSLQMANQSHEIAQKNTNAQSRDRINQLKKTFADTIENANEKMRDQIETMREESNQEKLAIKKMMQEQNTTQKSFLRQTFIDKINKVTEGYQKRVEDLENQNAEIKQTMDIAINNILEKTQAEVDRQQEAFRKSAREDVQVQKELLAERESNFRKNLSTLHSNYQRKMNELRLDTEKQMNGLTFGYEEKLKNERNKYQEIIDTNQKFFDKEHARLKLASDLERESLITQYEDRIAKMRDIYKDKQREVEHFNKLEKA